jgi:hypothetical protein
MPVYISLEELLDNSRVLFIKTFFAVCWMKKAAGKNLKYI